MVSNHSPLYYLPRTHQLLLLPCVVLYNLFFCVVFHKTQLSIRILNWTTRALHILNLRLYYFLEHSNLFSKTTINEKCCYLNRKKKVIFLAGNGFNPLTSGLWTSTLPLRHPADVVNHHILFAQFFFLTHMLSIRFEIALNFLFKFISKL